MKLSTVCCFLLLAFPTLVAALHKNGSFHNPPLAPLHNSSLPSIVQDVFNLRDYGAIGDGVADDGPALQAALDAIGNAGGGILFVPAGRYVIYTPVQKDFTGLASDVSILGVESLTPVPPPNSSGQELTRGLALTSEFAPRTGEQRIAVNITGLQSFLIKHITFIGTPGLNTDAAITLALNDIWQATIRHCEFYGLSSLVDGGAIVQAVRSDLTLEQSVFLGSTGNSGVYNSVVQNIEWRGITIADTVFADYGQRPELYGKLGLAAPLSWINIGNAAVPTSDSPRREAILINLFLDEGGLAGLSSLSHRFEPASAPIDLVYISGLYMNVSNLGTSGNYLSGVQGVLIENSHYGWSHNADSAINLLGVGNAILDRVECVASADRIRADAATHSLTVIDSVYNHLDSLAQNTRVITTDAPDEDPVQYVRQQFNEMLARDPDAAAHFYWSDQILQCGDNSECFNATRTALGNYLVSAPQAKFTFSGRVVEENGAGMPSVTVALVGSQNVTTETDANGLYQFSNLPTSGVYTVTPSQSHYTLSPASYQIVTPAADQVFNFAASPNPRAIGGWVGDGAGNALTNVTVTLAGAQSKTAITGADGRYVFADLPAGGNYTVTPRKMSYAFSPANRTFNNLEAGQTQNFAGTFVTYSISGILVSANNKPLGGATVTLSGTQNRTTTSNSAGEFSFPGVPSEGNYTVRPTLIGYSFTPSTRTFNFVPANQYHAYVGGLPSVLAFSAASYSVAEGTRAITVTVERTGTTSSATEVTYSASDGSAQQRSDVIPAIGRLSFEPGELNKSFIVFITDDSHVEGDESLTLELSDPVGAILDNNRSATLFISDNDSETAPNPIDGAEFFVRQHYLDFLNRSPDAEGLAFWSNQILSCGNDTACIADRRMNVSAAFFLSIEFRETGFLVYRLYQASYAQPPQHLDEFLLDTRTIGEGVVVNAPGWEQLLEANKTEFLENFVARSRFSEAYLFSLTPTEFVNLLNSNAGGPLSPAEFAAAVAEFGGAATSEALAVRARVLRRVVENGSFSERQLNSAFVLMQYFGYLQRNPNAAPDTNLDGYNFWLHKLEEFGGDFRRAEMVKSFLLSSEYRARFGTP
jgi:hypothetical protein